MDKFEEHNANDPIVTDVTIDVSSLHSISQDNYEQSNIPNLLRQLLQIYQPEDGIAAYRYVLKKCRDFLQNCDSRKKQLLFSLIPIPKNTPDRMIEEVFRTITGFVKPSLHGNVAVSSTILDIENMDENTINNSSPTEQNLSCGNNSSSSSRISLSKDFHEREISTVHNHATSSNNQLYDSANIWLDKSNKYQMSSYRQYLLNKRYYASSKNNNNESHLCYTSQAELYQDTCSMKIYKNNDVIMDLCQNDIPGPFDDIKYESKICNNKNTHDNEKMFNLSENLINTEQNPIIKQAIGNNIRKMDVCWSEDENIPIDVDDTWITVHDRLKTSLMNFLKRTQEDTSIELSAFPRIRSYPQMDTLSSVDYVSKDLTPVTTCKILENKCTTGFLNIDSVFLKKQCANISKNKINRVSNHKKKQNLFTLITGLKMNSLPQKSNKTAEVQLALSKNNVDYTMEKKAVTNDDCKTDDSVEESTHRYKIIESKVNDENVKNKLQTHSISELAMFKKQYYDTLLNVQRAKVAVTNSLASSSKHLINYDDSYFLNNMCQQQCSLTIKPQFPMCPTILYGLSDMHGNQYDWVRSNYKHLLRKQLRLGRQISPLCPRNQE